MPTATEVLRERFPEESSQADHWRKRLEAAEDEHSLYDRVRPYGRPVKEEAVIAVGLTAWPRSLHDRVVPVVVVHTSAPAAMAITETGTRTAASSVPTDAFNELELFQTVLGAILDVSPNRVPVIGMPRVSEQVAPGEETRCGASSASLGSRIFTSAGARAILTAGHAAPIINSSAYDASFAIIGRVADSVRCAAVARRTATPDIATIELGPQVPDTVGVAPASAGIGRAQEWDEVTAYGAKTSAKKAEVLLISQRAKGPHPSGGDFGEAIVTDRAISTGGDSGAPVYNQRGELVGHIVAGNSGMSMFQDVTYQLNAFNATLR